MTMMKLHMRMRHELKFEFRSIFTVKMMRNHKRMKHELKFELKLKEKIVKLRRNRFRM